MSVLPLWQSSISSNRPAVASRLYITITICINEEHWDDDDDDYLIHNEDCEDDDLPHVDDDDEDYNLTISPSIFVSMNAV